MAEGELAPARVVEQVDLVENEQPRTLRRADLREHLVHSVELRDQLILGSRGVRHVQNQVRLQSLLERGGERVHQLVRQLADEADRVREQVAATAYLEG